MQTPSPVESHTLIASISWADWLGGVGAVISGLSTAVLVIGAIAAWKSYQTSNQHIQRENLRQETQWLVTFFDSFYRDERFTATRKALEFNYFECLDKYVQSGLTGRSSRLTCTEEDLLLGSWLDNLLNVFEFLRFLESKGQVPSEEVEAIFSYYLHAFIGYPMYASLQLYCRKFGYKKIISEFEQKASVQEFPLRKVDDNNIFVYGTLKPGVDMKFHLPLTDSVDDAAVEILNKTTLEIVERDAWVSGRLLNAKDFPALLIDRRFLGSNLAHETDKIFGMVLKIQAASASSQPSLGDTLRALDIYEEADITGGRIPGLYGRLLYERTYVPVYCSSLKQWVGAWVYEYIGDQTDFTYIADGRWATPGKWQD